MNPPITRPPSAHAEGSSTKPEEHPVPGVERKCQVGKFIMISQLEYLNLFVRPVYRGIKLQVLAWIVYQTWGRRDWERGENRQFTERPISPATVARDIGRPRESVSRALADLRADGVLVKNEIGGEGIDKDRLHELAQRDVSVTPQTVMSTSHRDAHVTPTVMSTSRPRDAHVTVDPRKANPDQQLRAPQTIQTIQTKKRGALRKRAPAHPQFREFVGWWRCTWSEHNGGKPYVWRASDGSHLKRLLITIGFDDLKARAEYAFENAGKTGPLHWFKPPITFQEFAGSKVINKCSEEFEGSAGYANADVFMKQEREREITGIH